MQASLFLSVALLLRRKDGTKISQLVKLIKLSLIKHETVRRKPAVFITLVTVAMTYNFFS